MEWALGLLRGWVGWVLGGFVVECKHDIIVFDG